VRLELAGRGKELLGEALPNKVKVLGCVAVERRKVSSVTQKGEKKGRGDDLHVVLPSHVLSVD
jgi:hypothetical protein